MGVIFYKYKNCKDFVSLPIDGPFISVSELKYLIFSSPKYGNGRTKDFDLLIADAQTHKQFDDDRTLIFSNSSVLLRRIPGPPSPQIVAVRENPRIEPTAAEVEETQEIDFFDFGPEIGGIGRNVTIKKVEENQKLDYYVSNSRNVAAKKLEENQKLDVFGSNCRNLTAKKLEENQKALLNHGKGRTPPQGYVCRRCKVAGHYIQHCPTNGDSNFDLIKRVSPIVSVNNSNSSSSWGSVSQKSNIPTEFFCPLCNNVMTEAALTGCCCRSFCYECIKNHIIVSKGVCVCERIINASDVFPNLTIRDTITRYLSQSGNSTSVSCVTTEDAASASPLQSSEEEIKQQKKRKASLMVTEPEEVKRKKMFKVGGVESDKMPAVIN